MESSILPALVAVDTARNSGKTGINALAAAVPVLLNTSALTMPCREMCEAVISTCSCSRDYRSAPEKRALMSLYNSPMI